MLTRVSDIDDTIKISNVLDRFDLLRNTFLVDPQPVAGIPQLYASLARSLGDPQFVYISASPFQLYPFLNNFIDTTYAASKGPVLLQNVTMSNPTAVINFLTSQQKIFEYKVSQIGRLQIMYPNKKWLAIGDSTQKDPETYGEACVTSCALLFPKYNSLCLVLGSFLVLSFVFGFAFLMAPTIPMRVFKLHSQGSPLTNTGYLPMLKFPIYRAST